MQSPPNINIMPLPAIMRPGDSPQVKELTKKVNELVRRLDEVYRLLRADVEIMDMREPAPHASISHASWKWIENTETGDLELWHRDTDTWSKTYWSLIGELTRPT